MSGSSLIQSRWYFGKPPMMSGMVGCLYLVPEYLPARIRKTTNIWLLYNGRNLWRGGPGVSVTGSRGCMNSKSSLIRGVLYCLGIFQSTVPAEADTVSWYVAVCKEMFSWKRGLRGKRQWTQMSHSTGTLCVWFFAMSLSTPPPAHLEQYYIVTVKRGGTQSRTQ